MSSTEKITRTLTKATGGITKAEKKKLDKLSERWIKNAFRTDSVNKDKITDAIYRLYEAAGLERPRVVVAPSPKVMAYAYGIASAVWHKRGGAATRAATRAATDAATRDATEKAWLRKLSYDFMGNHKDANFALSCIPRWYNAYQGGNMWAYWLSYAQGMREVIGLTGLDCWDKYQAWEDAGREGGFRVIHEKFCIVSDFPKTLEIDEQNRPHSLTGPSHEWRDGWKLYHIDGVRFGEDEKTWRGIAEGKMTAEEALAIPDVDRRMVAIKYLGAQNLLKATQAKLISTGKKRYYVHLPDRGITRSTLPTDISTVNKLYEIDGFFRSRKYCLHYEDPSTGKEYISFVTQFVDKRGKDADAVMAAKHGMSKQSYLDMVEEA